MCDVGRRCRTYIYHTCTMYHTCTICVYIYTYIYIYIYIYILLVLVACYQSVAPASACAGPTHCVGFRSSGRTLHAWEFMRTLLSRVWCLAPSARMPWVDCMCSQSILSTAFGWFSGVHDVPASLSLLSDMYVCAIACFPPSRWGDGGSVLCAVLAGPCV